MTEFKTRKFNWLGQQQSQIYLHFPSPNRLTKEIDDKNRVVWLANLSDFLFLPMIIKFHFLKGKKQNEVICGSVCIQHQKQNNFHALNVEITSSRVDKGRIAASTKRRFRLQGSGPGFRVQGQGSGFRVQLKIIYNADQNVPRD